MEDSLSCGALDSLLWCKALILPRIFAKDVVLKWIWACIVTTKALGKKCPTELVELSGLFNETKTSRENERRTLQNEHLLAAKEEKRWHKRGFVRESDLTFTCPYCARVCVCVVPASAWTNVSVSKRVVW